MNKILLFVSLFLLSWNISFAQISMEAIAKEKIEALGLDESEVRGKLIERGVDIDNVNSEDPVELQRVRGVVEEVIAEMQLAKSGTQKELEEKALISVTGVDNDNVEEIISAENEFEEIIAEEVLEITTENNTPSPIYGQEIFRGNNIKIYRQAKDIKPSGNYVLGSGDEIAISIWGQSHENAAYEISKSGYIQPTGMGRIYLNGLTLTKAKKLLMSKYLQYYRFRAEEFEVAIAHSRTISVNIVGEVVNYGSFTIPSINTAFNALVAAGGPSPIGSVRKIELKRAGEATKIVDTYKFLNDPSTADNFYLQENDYLYVPVAEKVISIKGAVNRPYRYELLESENLKQLIEWAGGVKANAFLKVIQIERFEEGEKVIIDVNLKDLMSYNRDFKLQNGDIVQINGIEESVENYVEISGAVEYEQRFELKKGMKISDLIKNGVFSEDAITDYAYIRHIRDDRSMYFERVDLLKVFSNLNGPENKLLTRKDKIIIHSKATFVDSESISVVGAVRQQIELRYDKGQNLRISDLINMAGGVKVGATDFAFLYRKEDMGTKAVRYVRVNLKAIFANENSVDNLFLKPNDRLRVFSKATYEEAQSISIGGLVRNPSKYTYDETLTIKDVIEQSGGLKLEASSSHVDVFRINFLDNEQVDVETITLELDPNNVPRNFESFSLQPFDEIIVRKKANFELFNKVSLKGEFLYPGAYAIKKNETLSELVMRSGGLGSEAFAEGATLYRFYDDVGFVILKLDEVLKNSKSDFNYVLKDGDVIDIPKSKDIVTVLGATKANELYKDDILKNGKINVAFTKGKNAKYYVDNYAAGVNDKGRRKLITVEHPNGEVRKTKNFLLFNIYPKVRKGSVVSVGAKPVEIKKDRDKDKGEIDWNKVFSNSIAQISAVLTIILLVERIN